MRSLSFAYARSLFVAIVATSLALGCAGGSGSSAPAVTQASGAQPGCDVVADGPGRIQAVACLPETKVHAVVAVGDRLAFVGEQFTPPAPGVRQAWPLGPFYARLTPSGEIERAAELPLVPPSNRASWMKPLPIATAAGSVFVANRGGATPTLIRIDADGRSSAVPLEPGIALASAALAASAPKRRTSSAAPPPEQESPRHAWLSVPKPNRPPAPRPAPRGPVPGGNIEEIDEPRAPTLSPEEKVLQERLGYRPSGPIFVDAIASNGRDIAVHADPGPSIAMVLDPAGNVRWARFDDWDPTQRYDEDHHGLAIDDDGTIYTLDRRFRTFSPRVPSPVTDIDYLQTQCFSHQPVFCDYDRRFDLVGGRREVMHAGVLFNRNGNGGAVFMGRSLLPNGAVGRQIVSTVEATVSSSALTYMLASNGDLVVAMHDATTAPETRSFLRVCRLSPEGHRCTVLRRPAGDLYFGGFALASSDEVLVLADVPDHGRWPHVMFVRLRL